MRTIYAVVLAIGVVLLIAWILVHGVADVVDTWERYDPEERFGIRGRRVVAALFGFGMAGMSSAWAGWPMPATVIAAMAGAGASAWWAGVDRGDDLDERSQES